MGRGEGKGYEVSAFPRLHSMPSLCLGSLVCNTNTDIKTFRIGAEKLVIRDLRKNFIEELVQIHRSHTVQQPSDMLKVFQSYPVQCSI